MPGHGSGLDCVQKNLCPRRILGTLKVGFAENFANRDKCGALYFELSVAENFLGCGMQQSVGTLKMNGQTDIPRWKRMLDIVFVLLILPVVLPLAALIAVVIRLVSDGPVLFRQERVGHLGRRFMCLKFRTMFVGAETATIRDILSS